MKRASMWTCLAAVVFAPLAVLNAGQIDDELDAAMRAAAPDELLPALIYLADRVDLKALDAELRGTGARMVERHYRVVVALCAKADQTQTPVLEYLYGLPDTSAREIEPLWIANAIGVRATSQTIRNLADRSDVGTLFYNDRIEGIKPVSIGSTDDGGMRSGPEKGLVAIRATECWDIGYDGTGVLTSTLDTGVDGTHPALKDRWRGHDERYAGHGDWAFFDPVTNKTEPFDSDQHGTHTMGTVCGGDPGDQIGVAPGAQWINAAVIDRVNVNQTIQDAMKAFQWLIDPDGDPSTNWDVPAACSNSWRLSPDFGYPKCDDRFWDYLDACETAGIVILFSGGNEGPGSETMGSPPDRATTDYMCFSVGAVDSTNTDDFPWPIAEFSSRGPSYCTEDKSEAIKPEIAAPGVQIRSSIPDARYDVYSGTSMASPHINGVVCLMRQANSELLVDEIKQILFDTARDEGDEGDDNTYGHGMVDAYEAVRAAAALAGLRFDFPDSRPSFIDPDGGTTLRFDVVAINDVPIPGSGKFYVDRGDGFEQVHVKKLGDNSYEAVFPSSPCGIIVKYYLSAEGESGKTYLSPSNVPKSYYYASVFNGVGPAYDDNFETDVGYKTSKDSQVNSGVWERGVPVKEPSWPYAPATDGDGSGSCWLTGNETGHMDIDGGCVYLKSPALDMSRLISLRYAYWYEESGDSGDADGLYVQISQTGTDRSVDWFEIARHTTSGDREWHTNTLTRAELEAAAGFKLDESTYLRFVACDKPNGNIVEAAIDMLQIDERTCEPHAHKGDMDCDGAVSFNDVDPFVVALSNPDLYEQSYPACRLLNGDLDDSGGVDFNDIDPFVDCLVNNDNPCP